MLFGSDAVRRACVSSVTCNSSSRDGSACEIYGFMDAIDLFLRSPCGACHARLPRPSSNPVPAAHLLKTFEKQTNCYSLQTEQLHHISYVY